MNENQESGLSALPEKYALVTGASRGIGEAIATALAKEGFHLYLISRQSEEQLAKLAQRLSHLYGVDCYSATCDVSDPLQVEEFFSQIPSLDLLVNNAAISYVGLLHEMSIHDWDSLIKINLSSLFYCCKCAIPVMLKKKAGRIINISSVWGNSGASCEVAYSASKGGVNAFTKSLAKELAPSNIQVNALACGIIQTSMNHFLSSEEKEMIKEEIPADRFGEPSEVASMVVQLANSPTYLTGQIITFDGGWI